MGLALSAVPGTKRAPGDICLARPVCPPVFFPGRPLFRTCLLYSGVTMTVSSWAVLPQVSGRGASGGIAEPWEEVTGPLSHSVHYLVTAAGCGRF